MFSLPKVALLGWVIVSFSVFFISHADAIYPIDVFQPDKKIEIIFTKGLDGNLDYKFTEINSTLWIVNFTVLNDNEFNFSNFIIRNLTTGIDFQKPIKIYYNPITKIGYFYILFDNGFKENEYMEFGFNTTVISTGYTKPFFTNQRAICSNDYGIHIVFKKTNNTIVYAYSTDGSTWIKNETIVNSTGYKGTPHISCSGSNITIAYRNYSTASNMAIWLSENNGTSFTYKNPLKTLVDNDILIERKGTKIYVVYKDTDTYSDINFFNSSNAGSTWSSDEIIFNGVTYGSKIGWVKYYEPSLQINSTDSINNDEIFIVAREYNYEYGASLYTSDILFKSSLNSGNDFNDFVYVQLGIDANVGIYKYPSITYNFSNSDKLYVAYYLNSFGGGYGYNVPKIATSTDKGSDWSNSWLNTTPRPNEEYPIVTFNNIQPLVLYDKNYTNFTNFDIVFRNYTGSLWDSMQRITTDKNATVVNVKWYNNKNCIDLVYYNGSLAKGYNITYDCYTNVTEAPPTVINVSRCLYICLKTLGNLDFDFYDNLGNVFANGKDRIAYLNLNNDNTESMCIISYKEPRDYCINIYTKKIIYMVGAI